MKSCAHSLYHTTRNIFQSPALALSFQALLLLFLRADGRSFPAHTRLKSASALSRARGKYSLDTRALIRVYRHQVLTVFDQLSRQRRGPKPRVELIVDLTSMDKEGKFKDLKGWMHGLNKHHELERGHALHLCGRF